MFGLQSILANLDPSALAGMLVSILDKPGALDGLRAGIAGLDLDPAARARLIEVADTIKSELAKHGETFTNETQARAPAAIGPR